MPKYDPGNAMHKESSKPVAGLKNRLVLTWSPAQQKYNYAPANHAIVTKVGKAQFDKMLQELTKVQEYAFDNNIEAEKAKVCCYICISCSCLLCCCALGHVMSEYGKRMINRKNALHREFEKYQQKNFSKTGAKLTSMWSPYGGWWSITDNSPQPPPAKPAQAKPAPGKPAPAKPTPVPVVTAIPSQMKPQAMPLSSHSGYARPPSPSRKTKPAPNPASSEIPPDELLPIELITIPVKYLPAAGADYEEMMFGGSDDEDAYSEDMP
jgi:hypothetical protein